MPSSLAGSAISGEPWLEESFSALLKRSVGGSTPATKSWPATWFSWPFSLCAHRVFSQSFVKKAMNEPIQIERSTRISRLFAAFGLLLLFFLFIGPFYLGRSELYLLVEIFSYLALASLWNLLAGYTGLASVGQQGFVGLGGYSLFALTIFFRMPPIVAVLAAGLIAALLAVPTAWIIFRLKGAYFAIGTWVLAEVYRLGLSLGRRHGACSRTRVPTP